MGGNTESAKPKLLASALNDELKGFLRSILSDDSFHLLLTRDQFNEEFIDYKEGQFGLVLCGSEFEEGFVFELAQLLTTQCPSSEIIFIATKTTQIEIEKLKKNGFNSIFIWPADKEILKDKILKSMAESSSQKIYKQIRVFDLNAESVVPFATHIRLPLNKKYIRYANANERIGEKKIEKMKKYKLNSVYIDYKDAGCFYEYASAHIRNISENKEGLSDTERSEKLQTSMSGLLLQLFDRSSGQTVQAGREMVVTCQKIISNYVTGGKSNDWYQDLVRAVGGQTGGYSHASEVSTIAALLSIALQVGKAEDLAIAGFLHDVALTEFNWELLESDKKDWPKEQLKIYEDHTKVALTLLKSKKMILSDVVQSAILQHHEKFFGGGFPAKMSGDRICEEAQLLSLANLFQQQLVERDGVKTPTPIEALKKIKKFEAINPKYLRQLAAFFSSREAGQEHLLEEEQEIDKEKVS